MKTLIRVNERGLRIGESHPNAKLSDADVERMIADRGPDGAPTMSLAALAARYGLSKSGVKGILDGRRRGQIGPTITGKPAHRTKQPKVRIKLSLTLYHRAKLHRLGGSAWVVKQLDAV
jgi:hypothetical protein